MKTMLVVDDSEFMREIIKKYAEGMGITIVGEAESGVEGVEKYKNLKPDFVTMDIVMNEGDGIAALREIMQHNPSAVVMMVSSVANQESLQKEAEALGARWFLDKRNLRGSLEASLKKLLSE
jgi:two-component system chemotaxis response regulator CheY